MAAEKLSFSPRGKLVHVVFVSVYFSVMGFCILLTLRVRGLPDILGKWTPSRATMACSHADVVGIGTLTVLRKG